MMREDEIIMLVLGIGVFVFIAGSYRRLKQYSLIKILIAGFCFNFLGWLLTILEGFVWQEALNFAEHMCYFAGALCVVVWVYSAFVPAKEMD